MSPFRSSACSCSGTPEGWQLHSQTCTWQLRTRQVMHCQKMLAAWALLILDWQGKVRSCFLQREMPVHAGFKLTPIILIKTTVMSSWQAYRSSTSMCWSLSTRFCLCGQDLKDFILFARNGYCIPRLMLLFCASLCHLVEYDDRLLQDSGREASASASLALIIWGKVCLQASLHGAIAA